MGSDTVQCACLSEIYESHGGKRKQDSPKFETKTASIHIIDDTGDYQQKTVSIRITISHNHTFPCKMHVYTHFGVLATVGFVVARSAQHLGNTIPELSPLHAPNYGSQNPPYPQINEKEAKVNVSSEYLGQFNSRGLRSDQSSIRCEWKRDSGRQRMSPSGLTNIRHQRLYSLTLASPTQDSSPFPPIPTRPENFSSGTSPPRILWPRTRSLSG